MFNELVSKLSRLGLWGRGGVTSVRLQLATRYQHHSNSYCREGGNYRPGMGTLKAGHNIHDGLRHSISWIATQRDIGLSFFLGVWGADGSDAGDCR
jgi:hypothetical protein